MIGARRRLGSAGKPVFPTSASGLRSDAGSKETRENTLRKMVLTAYRDLSKTDLVEVVLSEAIPTRLDQGENHVEEKIASDQANYQAFTRKRPHQIGSASSGQTEKTQSAQTAKF